MNINRITACVQVRKVFGACFDFYTEKLGLVPISGNRNGPYTSFASCEDGKPFFAMFDPTHIDGNPNEEYAPVNIEYHTLAAVFHTDDFDGVYNDWLNKGVNFINKRTMSGEGWSFQMAEFRDPEGNLLSLEDGGV